MRSVASAIRQQNAGRDPERLAMKMAKMRSNPFIFLRGACHLFYPNLPAWPALTQAPLAWCCGDLHFENFGSYKADNRQVYFDINDFDEAALAPCTWDLVRLLTSLRCGVEALCATPAEALAASRECLNSYRESLLQGKPLWVERNTSSGLIKDLLDGLQNRQRPDFLDRRTVRKGNHRTLKVDGVKALAATADEHQLIRDFLDRFAAGQPEPSFFRVLDVARRIAGTGSLGLARYVVLVEGKGSPNNNYLLDIKQAAPSALRPALDHLGLTQPAWADEAQRVVTIQRRMQSVEHAFLFPVTIAGQAFLLKGLQPSEDRVAIDQWGKKLDRLKDVARTLGRIAAWDQLRASGRGGAPAADELIAFAGTAQWTDEVLQAADHMTALTHRQWREFCDG